ncbi:MAG: membrane dipeptidase [Clostridia bacterium]|nr:membrane dipeptidase [Clostridia bacterium]
MKICDLHCDTLFEIRKKQEGLVDHSGHISLDKLDSYDSFIQVMAMWSENKLTCDANYDAFLDASDILKRELADAESKGYKVRLAKSGEDILKNEKDGCSTVVFAVEGAKLLDNRIARLEMLYSLGVRILTLVWAGECPMGGAHDNDIGFTEFGLEVVKRCFELGIIPDVSHSNERQISQVLELASAYSKPVIASHSNSKSVHKHSRNLTDEHYKEIVRLGGVAGVSMACEHLAEKNADISDIVRHIMHYREIDPKGVCLGCDFDGVTNLPRGVKDVTSLRILASELAKSGLDSREIQNIMYNNARELLIKHLGKR